MAGLRRHQLPVGLEVGLVAVPGGQRIGVGVVHKDLLIGHHRGLGAAHCGWVGGRVERARAFQLPRLALTPPSITQTSVRRPSTANNRPPSCNCHDSPSNCPRSPYTHHWPAVQPLLVTVDQPTELPSVTPRPRDVLEERTGGGGSGT